MLAFEGVTSRYGDRTALEELSFTLERGERVAIVGPSGAGKTTLFRLCYAAFAPTAGRVLLDGADLAQLRGRALRTARSTIAVIFQNHNLVERLDVGRNVLCGTLGRRSTADALRTIITPRGGDWELARSALERVGLADRLRSRAHVLSGGQRQRVAIARGIAQRAQLVIADEPAASLDPELAVEIVDVLLRDAADRSATLLCSLHQPELARRFDRVLRIDGGRLASDLRP